MRQIRQFRILVAGIGNIFLGDDAFGCEVARVLAETEIPAGAAVVDFGVRGFDLAYALLEPYQTVILIDAIARGLRPGTVSVLQPSDTAAPPNVSDIFDPHSMNPARLFYLARTLGEITAEIYIVGCEPSDFGDELEGRIGLSAPVQSAVPEAAKAVIELIHRALRQPGRTVAPELRLEA